MARRKSARLFTMATAIAVVAASTLALGISGASAATVSGGGSGATPVQIGGEAYLNGGCKPYIFVGMRGSGEVYSRNNFGLGPTLYPLYSKLSSSAKFNPKGKSTLAVATPIDYKAMPAPLPTAGNLTVFGKDLATYVHQTVYQAGQELTGSLIALHAKCPTSKFILAGYSQGAYAIDYVRNPRFSPNTAAKKRIVGTVRLGDPGTAKTGMLAVAQGVCAGKLYSPLRKGLQWPNVCIYLKKSGVSPDATSALNFHYSGEVDLVSNLAWTLNPDTSRARQRLNLSQAATVGYNMHTGYRKGTAFTNAAFTWVQKNVQ